MALVVLPSHLHHAWRTVNVRNTIPRSFKNIPSLSRPVDFQLTGAPPPRMVVALSQSEGGGATFQVTNRDVVPYNPYLTLRYDCHINVEKSTSPQNCKYLYKYVTKGADRAMVSAEVGGEDRPRDEIADYKDLRSVGSQEAMWHLLGYPISRRYPAVQVLRVHQEDEQHVVFDEGQEELT